MILWESKSTQRTAHQSQTKTWLFQLINSSSIQYTNLTSVYGHFHWKIKFFFPLLFPMWYNIAFRDWSNTNNLLLLLWPNDKQYIYQQSYLKTCDHFFSRVSLYWSLTSNRKSKSRFTGKPYPWTHIQQ